MQFKSWRRWPFKKVCRVLTLLLHRRSSLRIEGQMGGQIRWRRKKEESKKKKTKTAATSNWITGPMGSRRLCWEHESRQTVGECTDPSKSRATLNRSSKKFQSFFRIEGTKVYCHHACGIYWTRSDFNMVLRGLYRLPKTWSIPLSKRKDTDFQHANNTPIMKKVWEWKGCCVRRQQDGGITVQVWTVKPTHVNSIFIQFANRAVPKDDVGI